MMDLKQMLEKYRELMTYEGKINDAIEKFQNKILESSTGIKNFMKYELPEEPYYVYFRVKPVDDYGDHFYLEMGYEGNNRIVWFDNTMYFGFEIDDALNNMMHLKNILEKKGYIVKDVKSEEGYFITFEVQV